jgi:hypothetical protein
MIKPSIKPSPAFISSFNKFKKDGLNEKETTSLLNQAQKEIGKSKTPHALAKAYTAEVKGWVKTGLVEKHGMAEMGGWILKSTADAKVIHDGAKFLRANAKALQAKNPGLKDLDLSTAKHADFGDSGFLSVNDKKGSPLKDTDPRAKLLQKAMGAEFKNISIGSFDE